MVYARVRVLMLIFRDSRVDAVAVYGLVHAAWSLCFVPLSEILPAFWTDVMMQSALFVVDISQGSSGETLKVER